MKEKLPLAEKALLTLEEASAYFNIGTNKIRELTADEHCHMFCGTAASALSSVNRFKSFFTVSTLSEINLIADCK